MVTVSGVSWVRATTVSVRYDDMGKSLEGVERQIYGRRLWRRASLI
jgi:hypothetical protein